MNPFYKIIENLYLKTPNNLAYYDRLTGLHNRNYYDMVIRKKYNPIECGIVFIDVNDLKKINDTYGHYTGTRRIMDVSEIIKMTKCDDSWRYGGDEFILVYKNDVNVDDLARLEAYSSYLSYGVISKESYEDMSSAIRKADEQMYKMKKKFHGKA